MIQKDFNEVVIRQTDRCKSILTAKGAEYAPRAVKSSGIDRLAHFKKAAVVMNSTPKAALMGMLSKHLISVSDMCTDDRVYPKEQWDEKITDSINYLLILRALVRIEICMCYTVKRNLQIGKSLATDMIHDLHFLFMMIKVNWKDTMSSMHLC